MINYKHLLKTEYSTLTPRQVLSSEINVSLGVSKKAKDVLKKIDINNVFDLALSSVFEKAQKIAKATNPTDPLYSSKLVPSDYVDKSDETIPVYELAYKDINILKDISKVNAESIKTALSIVTISDLALWPPYVSAKTIMDFAFNPQPQVDSDSGTPPDLLPQNGQYPAERVFYKTIVLDKIKDNSSPMKDLRTSGPIDISKTVHQNFGFNKPAEGAIVTFAQSWFTQGVTLGQLLHSVALAPGESTKIAMVDWSRRSKAGVTEEITEEDVLANVTGHSRAISEITRAVAQEAQSGFSRTDTSGYTYQQAHQKGEAAQAGGEVGAIVANASASAAASYGYSDSYGQNVGTASSFASSSGWRDMGSSMSQSIQDSTQQHAHSARNRRASIIKEVSQSESERITTRTVTNYNHMHALTVQYYEMVQLYRVSVEVTQVDACLFIPMKLIDFKNPLLINRFRYALKRAALSDKIWRLLDPSSERFSLSVIAPQKPPAFSPRMLRGGSLSRSDVIIDTNIRWNPIAVERLGQIMPQSVLTAGGLSVEIPSEAKVINIVGATGNEVRFTKKNGETIDLPLGNEPPKDPIPIKDLSGVSLKPNPLDNDPIRFELEMFGKRFIIPLDKPKPIPGSENKFNDVVSVTGLTSEDFDALVAHLEANRLHYSQVIWHSLDASTIALLLSEYELDSKPVMQLVDPLPVAIAGNYLVFRRHIDPKDPKNMEWKDWLEKKQLMTGIERDQRLVPLSSGGVFAEDVLGRSNSAEKLDITRFWNWQDSPIPITAPDIAPIQAGSRGQQEDPKPGNFSQPVLNIQNPVALPDPQGLVATINAISNGNMFRDMSGLAATTAALQTSLNASLAAARAASEQSGTAAKIAGETLAVGEQARIEYAKARVRALEAVMPLVSSIVGAATGLITTGGASSISSDGAKINHGAKLDQIKEMNTDGPTGIGSESPAQPVNGTISPKTGGSRSPVSSVSGSHEVDAFNNSLGGGPGMLGITKFVTDSILGHSPSDAGVDAGVDARKDESLRDPLDSMYIRRGELKHAFHDGLRKKSDGTKKVHQGWDLYAPKGVTNIYAVADGIVRKVVRRCK